MKRVGFDIKILSVLQLVFLLLQNPVFSQIITIGSAYNTTSNVPTNTDVQYSYSQQIFTSTEITQSGSICGISLRTGTADTCSRTLKIYLGHTSKTTFTSATDWIPIDSLTQVFFGSVALVSNSWIFITFDVPFIYNGTQNLGLAIDDNTQINDTTTTFLYTAAASKVLYYSSSTINPSITTPPSGSVSNNRNNIKIHFCSPTSMSNTPLTTCELLYSDPGGMNNYGNNQNFTQTITASTLLNTHLVIDFMELSIGLGDTLWIYDGLNTTSTLQGFYTNITYPFLSSAMGTSITFRFKSDNSSTSSGWLAHIYCSICEPVSFLLGSPCHPNPQSNTGYTAGPFCTDVNPNGITFPSATNGNANVFLTTPIGCLNGAPNPAWYFMQINSPGNMLIHIIQTGMGNMDVDFACWGPFYANNQADFMDRLCCGEYELYRSSGNSHTPTDGNHTNSMGGYPINNLIDCSFSGNASEWCYIPNAQSGQFYILLITNYYGNPGTINFNTVPLSPGATTDCSLLAQVSNNGPICSGSTIQLTCNNPQPNATYLWNGPNGFTSTLPNPIISNATTSNSGIYSLVITLYGQNSAPATTNLIVNVPPNIVLSGSATDICLGNSSSMTASGGTSYIWSNGLGSGSSKIVSPNTTTTYSVTGTLSGCTDTANYTINVHNNPTPTVQLTNQIFCPDDISMPVTATVIGGGGNNNFEWYGSNVNPNNSNNTQISIIPNDCDELYTVSLKVTDQFGCYGNDTVSYHLTDTISPWFMSLPFTYIYGIGTFPNYTIPNLYILGLNNILDNCWNPNTLTYSQYPPAGSIMTDSETVVITFTDPCGNSISTNVEVIFPIHASLTDTTHCSCYGLNDGSATVIADGGLIPHTYLWSTTPPQTTATATSLSAGLYFVTVTDALMNSTVKSVLITQPSPLTSNISGTPITCFGQSEGTAQISVSGGVPPYTYLWNTGANSNIINDITAGIFFVTVTDSHSCTIQDTITITQPSIISLTSNIETPTCQNDTGSIQITAVGGIAPYNYLWNNGSNSNTINNLATGIYSCTVTDQNGCSKSKTDTLNTINPMSIEQTTSIMETCDLQNGSITVTIQNGVPPYQYHWNNGVTTGTDLTNLNSGYYQITITDQNQCTDTTSIFIDLFDIQSFIDQVAPSICGRNDGSITIRVEGGSGNYEYLWTNINDFNNNHAFNLGGGQYTVSIKDQDCIDTINFLINEIHKPIACFETSTNNNLLIHQSFFATNCSQNANQYHWNFGDGTISQVENPSHSYNESGLKQITLTAINDYDCRDSVTHSISVNDRSIIYIPNSFTPNGDGLNDTFLPVCSYVQEEGYSMRIFNRWGEEIFYSTDYNYGWDGNYYGEAAPSGTYSYIIIYENLFGQQFKKVGSINILR
ncbi:MAG TPA: gliding motility-associated C-terminal domain-containing protein [Bacteroidales bacterium]|nr:gliding motility-associated C-terminal domain-containing protein [Bacteroidales bacterium]